MAPSKHNDRDARQARERLRAYQARQTVHEKKVQRRRRDNWIAAGAVVVIVTLAVVSQLLYFAKPSGTSPSASPSASCVPPTPSPAPETAEIPSSSLAENRTWTGTLSINCVELGVSLDGAAAPQAVSSTISLAQNGFYDGVSCHRLTNGGFYVLQCGDPNGDGTGGPGYTYGPIENAPSDNVYKAGTIAMARQGGNAESQGSQFFIVYEDTTIPSDAAGGYSVIGHVTSGLDTLMSEVTDLGVKDGGTDGAPAVTTTIDSFKLQ